MEMTDLDLKRLASYISDNMEIDLNMLAKNLVEHMKSPPPKRISQAKAWKDFGKAKVEAWKYNGQIKRYSVKNRFEFDYKELEILNGKQQTVKFIKK